MGNRPSIRHTKTIQKEARIVMVGLKHSGKTSLLSRLTRKQWIEPKPTLSLNVDSCIVRSKHVPNLIFNTEYWDLAGTESDESLMNSVSPHRHYFYNVDAIVFVVDSSDRESLEWSKKALLNYLKIEYDQNNIASKMPLLILANKQDSNTAIRVSELENIMDLESIISNKKWSILPCSALLGTGISEIQDWIDEILSEKYKQMHQKSSTATSSSSTTNTPNIDRISSWIRWFQSLRICGCLRSVEMEDHQVLQEE